MINHWQIKRAVATLRHGGVLAYPTEAVWGLGCDPWQQDAVERLLRLKRRPVDKGLILVAAGRDQLRPLLRTLSRAQQAELELSWPGPNTWLVPDRDNLIPSWIKGEHSSVALRVSNHPQVVALCRAFGGPLVSTSANLSGGTAAQSATEVRQRFGHTLDCLLPGALGTEARPSMIRDLCSGAILR
ncbi:MAG: L-threonylcarbamoyladenylate synthase [Motiliproteus sp.]|jgi:L-threonylcarbamoyladenylate synthase